MLKRGKLVKCKIKIIKQINLKWLKEMCQV